MLLSISEIPTLSQSLTRKTDQLAAHMNSLVGMRKAAGYPTKHLELTACRLLGCIDTGEGSSSLLEAGNIWVRGRGDEVQSVVWEKNESPRFPARLFCSAFSLYLIYCVSNTSRTHDTTDSCL